MLFEYYAVSFFSHLVLQMQFSQRWQVYYRVFVCMDYFKIRQKTKQYLLFRCIPFSPSNIAPNFALLKKL